jgi:NAD(P)H-flavin reductase
MSSIIFGEKINITTFESETHGATSGYVVGYDLDGILKQKDIITGSVSLIGAAAAGGSLSSALLIGNQTGITPIISSTSSYILSGSGVNKIDLNAGTITSGTSSSYSFNYLVVVLH